MKKTTRTIAVLLAAVVAACSGDTPTAPAPGGGSGTPGGGTSATTSVSLTVSNSSPVVNSTSMLRATVTSNGATVPDGTAVEFSTDLGAFSENGSQTIVRTTENGVATATLTSSNAGTARVRARAGNVSATATVTFRSSSTPPPGTTSPTISSISPTSDDPAGGEIVTITGSNFEDPVRVLFGNSAATVISSTESEIQVVAPAIDLPLESQFLAVDVTVITNHGQEGEQSVTAAQQFRYEREILTPKLLAVTPSSGPNEGNTRISILGEGFQAPVRVFFGVGAGLSSPVEAEVQQVFFDEIVVLTPPANGLGSELANQQVSIRVENMLSGTSAVLPDAFRYGPEMVITAISPGAGPSTGGTQVTIFGWGFDDPVAVTIGGVGAQPLKVSGTEIVARTSALASPCAGGSGEVSVTNIEDGTSATGPTFEYIGINPAIVDVSPSSVTEGGSIQVTVANAGPGFPGFTVAGQSVSSSGGTIVGDNVFRYTVSVPLLSDSAFDSQDCGTGGTQLVPTTFPVTFTNLSTGCSASNEGSVSISPTNTACVEPPVAAISPSSIAYGPVAVGTSADDMVTISNAGGGTMTVLSGSSDSPDFTIVGGTFPVDLAGGESASYTIRYSPDAIEDDSGTVTFNTSEGELTVAVSGSGT